MGESVTISKWRQRDRDTERWEVDDQTCTGFGPGPMSWEEAVQRDIDDIWKDREDFERWLKPAADEAEES